jgi:hypothetical protein
VNKTALSRRTNQKIGGRSPKIYVPKIVKEAGLSDTEFDMLLAEHFVDPAALRAADFDEFFEARFQSICGLVSRAMGKEVVRNASDFDPQSFTDLDDDEDDDDDETSESVNAE